MLAIHHATFIDLNAPVRLKVAQFGQALGVRVAVVAEKLVTGAYNGLRAQV